MASKKRRPRAVQAVTIKHVAEAAGVSVMTVSRVFSGRGPVKEETLDRVRRAAKKLNYRPNAAARHLAGGAPHRIGFIYSNPSNAYLSELLVGALEAATEHGLQIALARALEPSVRLQEIAALLESGVDAFVLPPSVCDSPKLLQLLRKSKALWVAITPADAGKHPLRVTVDDFDAARTMTARLVSWGHRHIGFIAGDPAYQSALDRQRGFLRALDEAGLKPGPIEQGYFSFQSGIEAAEWLLAQTPRCTAIFASNDDMAAGAISVAHRSGLHVPRDLTVVGFDDTPISSTVSPAITTVRQPISQMARTAVHMLADALRGDGRSRRSAQQLFHCLMVERQSSGPPPRRQK